MLRKSVNPILGFCFYLYQRIVTKFKTLGATLTRNFNSGSSQGFGSVFFADPDPGKNLHADPDPEGIRGIGLGVKGKNIFFLSFFHVSDDS